MSVNLLDLFKGYMTPELVGKVAGMLGENSNNTQKALDGAVPSLLAALMQGANTESGSARIFNFLKDNNYDGSMLGNLPSMLSGGEQTQGLMKMGAPLLSMILGSDSKIASIINLISSFSGISSNSSKSLLSVAGPILMSVLGKQVAGQGLGSSGLMNLILGQKSHIAAAAPSGLASILGLSSLSSLGDTAANAVRTGASAATSAAASAATETKEAAGGLMKWLLPLLLLGGAIAGLLYFLKGCNGQETVNTVSNTVNNAANTAANTANNAVNTAANAVGTAADTLKAKAGQAANAVAEALSFTLPGGVKVSFPKGSLEDQLITFVNDSKTAVDKNKWFNFDRLLFETGKATLKPESVEQLKNVAAILTAFPKVNIKIGGYTDNVGDAAKNKTLSQQRAENVKAELVKLKIDAKRMEAEGYGQEHPVASNDTEEGRQQNRRIAISVRSK
jgi:OOP family OmpA-OmpF porin